MQVTRQRRTRQRERTNLFGRPVGRRGVLVAAGIAVALGVTGTAVASTYGFGTRQVGQQTARGQVVSDDQYLKPYGTRTVVDDGKIMSSAVSPDGTRIAAALADGDAALVVLDAATGQVKQKVGTKAADDLRIKSAAVGQEGPTYSPDGTRLWLGQTDGYTRFTVAADGTLSDPVSVPVPADGSRHALVAGAVFSPDGSTVYAAVNGQNRVVALDAETGAVRHSWAVGNAPRGIVLAGGRLYVSNEGGRPARAGDTTLTSYGTQVPADPDTGATTTGTVSVIDPADPAAPVGTLDVGLHPTAVYAAKGAVFVTDTADNNVSVIDTRRNKVVQTIATQPWPEASVGYEPNAVALTADGRLLVTLGRANAVAVYRYTSAQEPARYVGLLPTDYFPAQIATVGGQVVVSNTRGIDARRPTTAAGHGTHDTTSSLTRFTLPDDRAVRAQTAKVFQQNGWTPGSVRTAKGAGHAKPVPVPARLGDPSTIKHVFLLVKENRTYDQVLGDDPRGDGDPALTTFGANVTPNQHALARQFGLYDNFYDVGTNSAEGHNWLMQSDNPEYTESSAGEYQRSYDTENDALGHQKTGFLWTGARTVGRSVKDFGEFQSLETKPPAPPGRTCTATPGPCGPPARPPSTPSAPAPRSPRSTRSPSRASRCSTWTSRTSTRSRSGSRTSRRTARRTSTCSGSPTTTPAAPRTPPPRSPTTTSRWAAWSTPSRTAPTGRTRRSSSSRTTPRTASTTSTATAPPSRSSAPGPRTAASTTATTRRSR